MVLNINVKFAGATEKIVAGMVQLGYASTKSEAIRLSVFEMERQHKILEALEDAETVRQADAIMEKIERGETKLLPVSRLYKILDRKIKEHEKSKKR